MKKLLLLVCLTLFAWSSALCSVTLDFKINSSTSYTVPLPNGSGQISGTVSLKKPHDEPVETGILTVYVKRADGAENPISTGGYITITAGDWYQVGTEDQTSPVTITFSFTLGDLTNVTGKLYVKFVQNNTGTSAKSNEITATVPIFNNNLIDPSTNYFSGSGDPDEITGVKPNGGNGTYTYRWEMSGSQTTGYTTIASETKISYNPGLITTTTYYRRVAMSDGLSNTSAPVKITVGPAAIGNNKISNPGASSFGNGGGDPPLLPGTLPTGGNGVYTYQWQSATADNPTGFTNIIGETGQNYNPYQIYYTMYYRRKVSSNGVGDSYSNTLVISVYPSGKTMADPIDVGNLAMCGSYGNSLTMSPAYNWGNDWGGPADDIFYKFNLTVPATVSLYNCKPDGVTGTLTLLDASGNGVAGASSPDQCDVGGGYDYLLQPGVYYIANEGPGGNYAVTMPINIYVRPYLILSPNVTIPRGGSTTLTAAGNGTSYSWSPSTGLSATTGSSVVASPTTTTTYTVWETGPGGCSLYQTVLVTVTPPPNGRTFSDPIIAVKGMSDSVNETEKQPETTSGPQPENPGTVTSLYPNPASHYVTFTFEQDAPASVYIMNTSGVVVKQATTTGRSAELNVNDLPAGLYLVKVVQQKTVRREKIVIER